MSIQTGLQKLGARLWACTYRAPNTSIRYTKKHAPKLNNKNFINSGKKLLHFRSNHSQMFFKIGAFKNFTKFTRKHLCSSHFLMRLQAQKPAMLLKRDFNTVYSCEICEIEDVAPYRTPQVAAPVHTLKFKSIPEVRLLYSTNKNMSTCLFSQL